MVTIFLMRHAKAVKPSGEAEDFDRALQPVGRADAQEMGRMLSARFGTPERVLCSASRRTRETLDALGLDTAAARLRFSDELFDGTRESCVEALRGEDAASILVVGHNPGMHDAAMWLTGQGEPQAWAKLAGAFPTASLAVLEFPGPLAELSEASCFLRDFLSPDDLPA